MIAHFYCALLWMTLGSHQFEDRIFDEVSNAAPSSASKTKKQSETLSNSTSATISPRFTLVGEVKNRDGKPIGNASIQAFADFDPIGISKTDDKGRFSISSPRAQGLLIIRANGFRTSGYSFHDQVAKSFSLSRKSEPSGMAMPVQSWDDSRASQRKLAKTYLDASLRQAISKNEKDFICRILCTYCEIEPDYVLKIAQNIQELSDQSKQLILVYAARTIAKKDEEEGIALLMGCSNATLRRQAIIEMLQKCSRRRREELIVQAVILARGETDPAFRAVSLGSLAYELLKLGMKEKAAELFAEGQKIATQLPNTGKGEAARGDFATCMVAIDRGAALKLIDNLAERKGEFQAAIAIRGIQFAPEEAVKVHLANKSEFDRNLFAPALCSALARIDIELARKVADNTTSADLRANCYANIAWALKQKDAKEARTYLDRAYVVLEKEFPASKQNSRAAAVGAAILPVAARIAAENFEDYLWRTIALHVNDGYLHRSTASQTERCRAALTFSALLHRYDPSAARVIATPAFQQVMKWIGPDRRIDSFEDQIVDLGLHTATMIDTNKLDEMITRKNSFAELSETKSVQQTKWSAADMLVKSEREAFEYFAERRLLLTTYYSDLK